MDKVVFRGKGWLAVGLSLLLCLALIGPAVASATAEGAEEGCDGCPSYPIMRPDRETRERWMEAYNNAPRVYIDRAAGFQTFSLGSSHSLLHHLDYTPAERNQGDCGNCWAWAGTGVMEIALSVQEGIRDRLSVQYINSCQWDAIGKPYCAGGRLGDVADFYDPVTGYDPLTDGVGQCIPWANSAAHWQSGDWLPGPACGSVSIYPNYPITAIREQVIPTLPADGVTNQAAAIANIKSVLNQGRGIWFGFFLPDGAAWSDFQYFWDYGAESEVYDMDRFCGTPYHAGTGGGHAVLCVGYNDHDPDNRYWIMLNSWGTTARRPNGLFRVNMDMKYDCTFYDSPFYYPGVYWQTLDVAFDIAGQPEIAVAPTTFDVTLDAGTTWNDTLTIGNDGGADLTYEISHADCPWLAVSPAGGSVAPGGSHDLTVTIVTSGLDPGDHSAEIAIANNDPDPGKDPAIVPVTLHVRDVGFTITTEALPDGQAGVAYEATLEAAGGTPPYTWQITGGVLPGGLGVDAGTGVISGTPAGDGVFDFTVRVTDGENLMAERELSIRIGEYTASASRTIQPLSIAPGGTVEVTVEFESLLDEVQGFALVEEITAGWRFGRVDDGGAAAVKVNGVVEWLWLTVEAEDSRTVVYTLTTPDDADGGDYQINGVVKATRVDNLVLGDAIIRVGLASILDYYRDNFGDPGVCDLDSVLGIISHWHRDIIPNGFDQPPTLDSVLEMISCWLGT